MPRTRFPAIQIEGAFAQEVLGTFNIIRWFATLQQLAKISDPFLMLGLILLLIISVIYLA
jgi:hypothetical protein